MRLKYLMGWTQSNTFSKLFWFVFVVKVILSLSFESFFIKQLFLPFVEFFVHSPLVDPWQHFWDIGKQNLFPYSVVMLAVVSFPKLVLSWLGIFPQSHSVQLILLKLPLLLADVIIFSILRHWFPNSKKQVVLFYWCSPILIYISYIHGQLDAVPTAFLFISLFYLFKKRMFCSGLSLGIGIAAKAHLLIAIPFLVLFNLKNSVRSPQNFKRCLAMISGLAVASIFVIIPLVTSEGYRNMVLGTPEALKFFALYVSYSKLTVLYLAPVATFLICFQYVAIPRINRDTLILFLALIYGVMILFAPPMPGWYFWSIPLGIYFVISHEKISAGIYWLVNVLYLIYFGALDYLSVWDSLQNSSGTVSILLNLVFTVLQTSVAYMVYWIYRMGLRSKSSYELRQRPICIGIGGDSGSGKDYLSCSLRAIVGRENSVQNDGDDYHRWNRNHENWTTKTHLSPESNYMLLPLKHLQSLKHWKSIKKKRYDHALGTFTNDETLNPKPFLFYVGLHPFFIRKMRKLIDIKIYLDPNPNLRKYWKVIRDQDRGHSVERVLKQLEQRQSDSEKYVAPQREFADWVIQYQVEEAVDLSKFEKQDISLGVIHTVRNDINLEPVARELSRLSSLDVKWLISDDLERQTLEVHGSISTDEVQVIAFNLVPNVYELIGNETMKWMDQHDGITQLLFICIMKDLFERPVMS